MNHVSKGKIMKHSPFACNRRAFLRWTTTMTAGAPLAMAYARQALAAQVFESGAKRVRFVESTQSRADLETSISFADWDVNALLALGKVEFENTRNLGKGARYSRLRVPSGGYVFSTFDLNHSYEDTD